MKLLHNGYIYESVEGFMKDDRLFVDISKITPSQYTQINNRLKGFGYDVRGANDIKKILDSYKKEVIDGVEYTRIGGSDDWVKVVGEILKITKPEKIVKDKNVLSTFLKNIAKDKESGITIGEYISSGTAYILPDGKTINFRTGSSGNRGDDHRYIVGYLNQEFKTQTDGMYYFMDNTGAIRFIPESPAFDIRTPPTSIQLNKIENYVNKFSGNSEVGLDLYSPKFGRKGKFYPSGITGARIKSDILRFYNSGETGMDYLHEHSETLLEMPVRAPSMGAGEYTDERELKGMNDSYNPMRQYVVLEKKIGEFDYYILEEKGYKNSGMLYVLKGDGFIGHIDFTWFRKDVEHPNAILIDFTYLLSKYRGKGIIVEAYKILIDHYGAIVSDKDLTPESNGIYNKLAKEYSPMIYDGEQVQNIDFTNIQKMKAMQLYNNSKVAFVLAKK